MDRAFEEKLKSALADKDWTKVIELFDHYGHYLELVEPTKEKVDAEA